MFAICRQHYTFYKLCTIFYKLKFTVTGSEAVQAAFRIMRAYTGKNVIVRFQGNYAGWGDNVLGGRINSDVNAEIPFTDFSTHGGPEEDPYYTEGRSPLACKETIMIPWNNFEVLEYCMSMK